MIPRLRPYQREAHAAVFDALLEDYTSLILTAATGTGKTVTVAAVIRTFLEVFKWRVLFLAPAQELIDQAYRKIRDMCCLMDEVEIDKEMGALHFDTRARVVVGSWQTCYKETRLKGWTPNVIIVDESHQACSPSYKAIFDRFPEAILLGITATAHRGDRQPVFMEHIDGRIVEVVGRDNKPRPAEASECAFIKHIHDYPLEAAVNDGWLVPPHGYVVDGGADISQVATVGKGSARELSQGKLTEALEKNEQIIVDRINRAIRCWKDRASDLSTVVFCPSVKYAHWAADLWRQAGYTAQSIDATTDALTRSAAIEEIHRGNIQVTCNYGVYTQGVDIDKWACVVLLRPTLVPSLMMQMIGRGTRPLDPIGYALGDLVNKRDRRELIARSGKPRCVVIDVVDICGKHKIATLPTALGLPANLNLQGHSLAEAAALVREFESVKERALYDCPATYEELEVSLREIALLDNEGVRSRDEWAVTRDGGYQFSKARPGYGAKLIKEKSGEWRLVVHHQGEIIYDRLGASTRQIQDQFDRAALVARKEINKHQVANPPPKNTLALLSDKQLWHLRKYHSDKEIDAMPLWKAKKEVGEIASAYWKKKTEFKNSLFPEGVG